MKSLDEILEDLKQNEETARLANALSCVMEDIKIRLMALGRQEDYAEIEALALKELGEV